jgi:hypothetical protein
MVVCYKVADIQKRSFWVVKTEIRPMDEKGRKEGRERDRKRRLAGYIYNNALSLSLARFPKFG